MSRADGTPARRVRRVVLLAAAGLVIGLVSGCGSRLDDSVIVDALHPAAPQVAAAADVPSSVGTDSTTTGAPAGGTVSNTTPSTTTSAAKSGASDANATTTESQNGTAPAPHNPVTAPSSAKGPTGTKASTVKPDHGPAAPISAAAAPGEATAHSATKTTLTFGNIGSYSGLFGPVENGDRQALAAWFAWTNNHGGLDGHPIKLIVGDDQADPVTGLTLAKRMVENDHVLAFVANLNVFGFDQYADYAKSKGIPFIGGDAVNPRWFTDPNAFPSGPPATTQIEKGLSHFVTQSVTRIGMAYCLEVAKLCGYLNDQTMKSPVGKYIVDDEQVSLVAPSYTSQCLRMQAAKVEAMYLLMDGAGAARFVQNCATQGFNPAVMVAALDATPDFPTIKAMQSAYIPGATVAPSETQIPAVAQYRQAMQHFEPGVGDSGFAVLGWVGGMILGKAGAHLSDQPTVDELLQNLWKMKGETFGGLSVPLTFAKGKAAQPSTCVFLWGLKNGKFVAPQGPKPEC